MFLFLLLFCSVLLACEIGCPMVVARGTRAELVDEKDIDVATTADTKIAPEKCLYFGGILVPNPETQAHLKTILDEDKLF